METLVQTLSSIFMAKPLHDNGLLFFMTKNSKALALKGSAKKTKAKTNALSEFFMEKSVKNCPHYAVPCRASLL